MDPRHLAERLQRFRPPLADSLVVAGCLDSTQELARHIVSSMPADAPLESALIVALEQTAGRGREARFWWSPLAGGAYATYVWRIENREWIGMLPVAVAVGLCEAVRQMGVRRCSLKWPNDLVVGERKIGGVLIDVVGSGEEPVHAVIGFGLNRAAERDKLAELKATSMALETDDPPGLAEMITESCRCLLRWLGRLDESHRLVERYREMSAHRPGDRIVWCQNREMIEGVFQGIDDRGFLELETERGSRLVHAGTVVTG